MRVQVGRIAAIRPRAPRGAAHISLRGAYLSPGFIDLHIWGDSRVVAQQSTQGGTTAFLCAVGPEPRRQLLETVAARAQAPQGQGAKCLGLHLEGPFLSPMRAGVLPYRAMREPTIRELIALWRAGNGRVKLVTLAPELRGAEPAIRWCRRHRIAVSLGHSDADAREAVRATDVGAQAVTHVFNSMRSLHHRDAGLLGVALTDPRLTTMVIADGVHVGSTALRLLVRAKGRERIALVTDSVRHQVGAWQLRKREGAYYLPAPRSARHSSARQAGTREWILAGSCLTMIDAVKQMVRLGGVSLREAVQMASATPARLLGLERSYGSIAIGKRADLTVFDKKFRVTLTMVGGRIVYQRSS